MDKSQTISRRRRWLTRAGILAVGAGVLTLGACQLDVENPSNIEDKDLNDSRAVQALEAGVAGDFAYATVQPGGGGIYNAGAMLTDELVHVGTWVGLRGLSDGKSYDDWVESQSRWAEPSQARWTAEKAIARIDTILTEDGQDPSSSSAVAHVTMWAGHANRVLGDNFCNAVIDGGPMQDHTVFYDRAVGHFQSAIQIADNAGEEAYKLAAIGGLAHVYMMQGEWEKANAEAAKIDTDFVFEQVHRDGGREENNFRWWGHDRDETSVWGTPFADWGVNENDPDAGGDPRVSYYVAQTENDAGETVGRKGGDDRRPFYPQLKYTSYGDNIAVVKGTEMRLLEAEYELVVNSDIQAALDKIDLVRDHHGLDPVDRAAINNIDDAWALLMKERGLELWLEGKRLPDFRRWKDQPGYVPFDVVRESTDTGDAVRNVLDTEVMDQAGDMCIRISKNEKDSNQNL